MNQFVRWLKRPVALNYATVIFCFLQGATLSIPAGYFLAEVRAFDPPVTISIIYICTAFGGAVLLPFWSLLVIAKTEMGLGIFGFISAILVMALSATLQAVG